MEDFLKLLENTYVQILLIMLGSFIMFELIGIISRHIKKKKGTSITLQFTKGVLQTIVIITAIIKIGSYSKILTQFSSTILMSSSLIVVVLGFVFQEGLSNIVHGFIILMFKPFKIGDRLQVSLDGNTISGIVSEMNLRHTKIITILDNAPEIIPNSKLDVASIRNFSNGNDINRYPLQVDITYESAMDKEKRELAKSILRDTILTHKLTIDTRQEEDKETPYFVKVNLDQSSVRLTSFVTTKSYEDNVIALSEITETIIDKYTENHISFAFPHTEISGEITVDTNDLSNPAYIKKMAEGVTSNLFNKNKKNKKKEE